MTDRELLELAAKAAGISVGIDMGHFYSKDGLWAPLEDDSAALRLAVKMGLNDPIGIYLGTETCTVDTEDDSTHESHGGDPYAATRRAIVRAAAEIGKSMGEKQ